MILWIISVWYQCVSERGKAGNYLQPVYLNIAINCDTFLKVTNLLWSSPIFFFLAFFSSISIHTVYLKSHCASVIILCRQFCANPLNPYQCLSSLRLHSCLYLHLHHQRLHSGVSCPNPITAVGAFCQDGPLESNYQITLNSVPQ